jgi:hypothetical protein
MIKFLPGSPNSLRSHTATFDGVMGIKDKWCYKVKLKNRVRKRDDLKRDDKTTVLKLAEVSGRWNNNGSAE